MTKVKNVPLTIRIDSDLHDILKKRASESGETTNGYIREKLYEIGSAEALPVKKYEEIQELIESAKKKIRDDLSNFHGSISLMRSETNKLKNDIRSIEEADLIFSKTMKTIDTTSFQVGERLKGSFSDVSKYTAHLNELMENAENRIGMTISKVLDEYESEELKKAVSEKLKLKSTISTASLAILCFSSIMMVFSLVSAYLIYA